MVLGVWPSPTSVMYGSLSLRQKQLDYQDSHTPVKAHAGLMPQGCKKC
jgi:hypothetical protein